MTKTLDVRKVPCPGPVIEMKKALKDMDQGTLEILVDNQAAVLNLEKMAAYLNLKSSWEPMGEKEYKVRVQAGEILSDTQEEISKEEAYKKGCLVVLSADHMGEGDGTLGKNLMKGFVYALTKQETLPETILLYNGGARLSTAGADTLEDLKWLESQGVGIMTCGTCVDFYGLGQPAVGTITNMYEIAEKMMAAETMVKP